MTLSIYFANFFNKKDINQLVLSMETQMLTHQITKIPGAPGCSVFKTKYTEFPFCFENEDIRKQIQDAVIKFLSCKNEDLDDDNLKNALSGCDLTKLDLSIKGPFGKLGEKIKEIMTKMKGKNKKNLNSSDINPYYRGKGVPGDEIKTIKKRNNIILR